MKRCPFCKRLGSDLVAWGEPVRIGIARGSTRYRTVQTRAHQSCIDAYIVFDAASRARSAAEDAAMFAAAFERLGVQVPT